MFYLQSIFCLLIVCRLRRNWVVSSAASRFGFCLAMTRVCFNVIDMCRPIYRFLIDGNVVRTVENIGGHYPVSPFRVYGSIWNASDWATGSYNHRIPIDYAYQVREVEWCIVVILTSRHAHCLLALFTGIK